jgi:hypothetical protein
MDQVNKELADKVKSTEEKAKADQLEFQKIREEKDLLSKRYTLASELGITDATVQSDIITLVDTRKAKPEDFGKIAKEINSKYGFLNTPVTPAPATPTATPAPTKPLEKELADEIDAEIEDKPSTLAGFQNNFAAPIKTEESKVDAPIELKGYAKRFAKVVDMTKK